MDKIDIKKILEESFGTYTVEEALKAKAEEEKKIDESFELAWNNYHSVSAVRKAAIKNLRQAKIKFILLNYIAAVINNNAYNELEHLINFVNASVKELKDQKEILSKINIALEKLQYHRVMNCNYDICELLSYLFEKDDLLFKTSIEEIRRSNIRIKGINTMYNDEYDLKLDETNKKIDEKVLILGLDK